MRFQVIGLPTLVAVLMGAGIGYRGERQPALELSCARFAATMTEAELQARYGVENLVSAGVVGFDDGPQPGAVVFPNETEARLEIIWADAVGKRWPAVVLVRGSATRWRTPSGIRVGMDLRSLEQANGRPFRLRGFWAEGGGGGRVLSWAGGRLEMPRTEGCAIGVYLQPAYDGSAAEVMRQITPGREFSSGHPAFQAVNPRVVVLTVEFR
jgi:hypothetical protein